MHVSEWFTTLVQRRETSVMTKTIFYIRKQRPNPTWDIPARIRPWRVLVIVVARCFPAEKLVAAIRCRRIETVHGGLRKRKSELIELQWPQL